MFIIHSKFWMKAIAASEAIAVAAVAHASPLGHLYAPENGKHSPGLWKLDLHLEIICLGVRVILQSFQKMSVFVKRNVWLWANLCLLRGQKKGGRSVEAGVTGVCRIPGCFVGSGIWTPNLRIALYVLITADKPLEPFLYAQDRHTNFLGLGRPVQRDVSELQHSWDVYTLWR